MPHLIPLLENPRLERLIQNLFILSLAWKAFPSSVSSESVANIDERQFKTIVWADYVERASQKQGGLPLKRRSSLIAISVHRARRMSLFVPASACDPEAVQALVDDGILIESEAGGYAPAHDVLEDWAVSRFIAQEFEASAGQPAKFLTAVGTEPAMRRGFRLWLSETLGGTGNQAVMDFVLSTFQRDDVPPVWRDEIAVSVLRSDNAGEFIRRVERLLLDKDKALYRRLAHVLCTACKGPNESLLNIYGLGAYRSHLVLGSIFVIPVGSGWGELIQFTYRNLDFFDLNDTDTVLGILKDWAQLVGPTMPIPPESGAVAQICLKYWGLLSAPNVYAARQDQEFLKILFKIPQAARNDVEALIRSALAAEEIREYRSRTILEQVTKSLECQALCEHLPELVIEVARESWRFGPDDDDFNSRLDLEQSFGLTRYVQFDYIPPSSLQGPFAFLLAHHPALGIRFIVRLVNECAETYANSEFGNEVVKIEIPNESGARTVIGSARLWYMYRGMAPAPTVLECGLMALEAWLLEQAKQKNDIRDVFREIFETSRSVATMAVLASVAVAYPEAVGDDVVKILEIREFYQWDFARSYQERSNVPDLAAALGIPTQGIEKIYDSERKRSAELPHRKSNLEELAFRLQLTPIREKVWTILDRFLASLPCEDKQTEADKTWRIALHRMDARHFKAEEGKEPGQIILTPSEPPADLQNFINEGTEVRELFNRRMRLANWGMTHFRGESQENEAFSDWCEALAEAQALKDNEVAGVDATALDLAGPFFVAAYVIRDHFSELQPAEVAWCRRVLIAELIRKDADKSRDTRISRSAFEGSRPAALVLPLLLRQVQDDETSKQVEEALAIAVTHTSEEVRDYVAEGIRAWLWDIDPKLAKACVGGLVELAAAENRIRTSHRRDLDYSVEAVEREIEDATGKIRERILNRQTLDAFESLQIDLRKHDWPELLDALSMVKPDTDDADLKAFFMVNLEALLREAEAGETFRSTCQVSYEFQHPFANLFARFALARPTVEAVGLAAPLRDNIEKCPRFIAVLLESLPVEEDRVRSGAPFWTMWYSVAGPVFKHRLLRKGSRHVWRYSEMCKLVRILLFADVQWKKEVTEWEPATSNRDFFEFAASEVGNTPAGFGALVSLLNTVGQVFLPDAVNWLAQAIESSQGTNLLEDRNTDFELEVLLRNLCYSSGTVVRQRPELHRAVLMLLDKLVERGSHTAFRLRDYIVAPLPAAD
jgi:hypothetical protein